MARSKKAAHRSEQGIALPALAQLSHVPSPQIPSDTNRAFLQELAATIDTARVESLVLALVVRLDRGFPALLTETGLLFRAEYSAQLAHAREGVAIGDWVVVSTPTTHDMGIIEAVCPRTTTLSRWKGNARGQLQTLAANITHVLIVQALQSQATADLCVDLARIARSALVSADSGAQLAVVLTKADRVCPDELEQALRRLTAVFGTQQIPIIVVGQKRCDVSNQPNAQASCGSSVLDQLSEADSALKEHRERAHADSLQEHCERTYACGASWGIEALQAYLYEGSIAVMLGESGAGKSTLLNALLGEQVQATGEVRQKDDAGRHTTVTRRMVQLRCGGIMVDAPGLRSLPLMGHEDGLQRLFGDVCEQAQLCKFRDCTHTHEPGCAVQQAALTGRIRPEHIQVFVDLANELRLSKASLDPDIRS